MASHAEVLLKAMHKLSSHVQVITSHFVLLVYSHSCSLFSKKSKLLYLPLLVLKSCLNLFASHDNVQVIRKYSASHVQSSHISHFSKVIIRLKSQFSFFYTLSPKCAKQVACFSYFIDILIYQFILIKSHILSKGNSIC